jgi:hypothetical protein
MSLSPILGVASQVLNLFGGGSPSNSSGSSSASSSGLTNANGSVDLSQAAQLFSKLQNLSQTDATKFKQLTAQISSQLQQEADGASGSEQSFLSNLSNQFSTASQTGSTSALQPQAQAQTQAQSGTHHAHGHHHSSSQAAYDLSSQTTDSAGVSGSALQSIFQQVHSL